MVSTNEETSQTVRNLSNAIDDWKLIVPRDADEGIDRYRSNSVDYLLVDLECDESQKLLSDIVEINPKQNTISFSKKITCIDTNGCDYCAKTYNRKKILKPFSELDLYKVLDNFGTYRCSHRNALKDITLIMSYILKRFSNCKYNIHSKQITINDMSSFNAIRTIAQIVELLNENSISYTMTGDYSIQI